ncbi:uncharacterized protein [Medicago truncatula]|uniref:uncharacterized protein n=1 Tax=Medicago truncatula TaxID=3880 RepID=UPI0019687374|nr:uncharacterized protein LOC120580660 [Medicago truncatula]
MKRKAFSLSPFSSAVQISECVPSSCSKNLKKPKILDEVNSMAAKASDSNWPPLLDEKMLEVFIAAHLRAMRSGPHLNSHSLEFWNKAETEVNRIITENFPQLLPKDVESLRKRLKYLRCNPKNQSNDKIVLLVRDLFTIHDMIIPNKLPGYPEYNYSFGSGQSSGGGPSRSSGRGGPIRRNSSSTDPSSSLPPVNELDDQHDVGACL